MCVCVPRRNGRGSQTQGTEQPPPPPILIVRIELNTRGICKSVGANGHLHSHCHRLVVVNLDGCESLSLSLFSSIALVSLKCLSVCPPVRPVVSIFFASIFMCETRAESGGRARGNLFLVGPWCATRGGGGGRSRSGSGSGSGVVELNLVESPTSRPRILPTEVKLIFSEPVSECKKKRRE